jgi:hypothetical protein
MLRQTVRMTAPAKKHSDAGSLYSIDPALQKKDSGAQHGVLELEPAHGHVLISAPARSRTPEGYGTSSASVSISIIFDACGYARAGRTGTAVQVFANLRASGYTVGFTRVIGTLGSNVYVIWASWTTRCGTCLEMRSGLHGVSPDEQGARILLKFANQRGVGDEVRMRNQRLFCPRFGKSVRRISCNDLNR